MKVGRILVSSAQWDYVPKRSITTCLFCIILSVLGAMQFTDRLALTSSLQTAMEKRPKLARTILSARPAGQERLRVLPSHAYDVVVVTSPAAEIKGGERRIRKDEREKEEKKRS